MKTSARPAASGGDLSASMSADRGLRFRIIALLLLVSTLPLVLVGVGAGSVLASQLQRKSLELQKSVVKSHALSIEAYLFERLRALELVTRTQSFEELQSQASLQRIFDALNQSYNQAFVDLGTISAEGAHLAYVGPYDLLSKNYSQAAWFHAVMAQGRFVSDVFLGFRNVPHCIVAVTRREAGRTLILRATFNSDAFESLVQSEHRGSSGDAYIVNADGIYQTPARHGKVLERACAIAPLPHPGVQEEQLQSGGQAIVRVTTWINGGRWLLVVEESEAEVRAPVQRALMWGALIVLLAIGLIALTTVLATRHLTRQIARATRERDGLFRELLRSAKLASLGEMAAGLAHEINNPLAIIMTEQTNIGDLVGEIGASPAAQEDLLDKVALTKRQVERCGGITAKMLQFGRVLDAKLQATDIAPCAKEIVAHMMKQAALHNVEIAVTCEPDLPKVLLDPVELQQVMFNIIQNSLYAIQGSGRIEVDVRREGDHVRLAIKDNGSGIPPEDMARIFEPFFTTKPVGEGTGLGLPVCYGIVQKWKGTIEAESEVGVGTEMVIRLPIPDA